MPTVLIMAGGTGGHIFPGLAVARALQEKGIKVVWLGTKRGLESLLIPKAQIPIHYLAIHGIRGKNIKTLLFAPLKIIIAIIQAVRILRRVKPDLVLGFGGFASGPGGIAAKLLGKPLIIHEQNAVAGVTNRLLAHIAKHTLCAFPNAFPSRYPVQVTGNPLRLDITNLPPLEQGSRQGAIRILVLGGSLGAQILNETVPQAIALLKDKADIAIQHQAGRDKARSVIATYQQLNITAQVNEFIEDMPAAYSWADLVICRAGALTVSEIAAVGIASILVPYPHAVDDHQTANANYLVQAGAGIIIPQAQLTAEGLAAILSNLLDRERLSSMAIAARKCAVPDAAQQVVNYCLKELML